MQKIEGITVPELFESEMVHLYMADSGPLVAIQGRHCLVLQILATKRDPLVLRPALVEAAKGTRLTRVKATVALTDAPNLLFNSYDHFAKITRLLIGFTPTPNAENMLKFSVDFKGLTQLTTLTDELLGDLNK